MISKIHYFLTKKVTKFKDIRMAAALVLKKVHQVKARKKKGNLPGSLLSEISDYL